jgi:antirestriction protein ArdC
MRIQLPTSSALVERIDRAETFFANIGADIRNRGDRAYYAMEPDYIQLPVIEAFRDAESYYAILAHESAHWTRPAWPANSTANQGAMKICSGRTGG